MQIEAYCDECFSPVPREHAKMRQPCPKCGNTYYAVLNLERQMPNGRFAYFMQREENMQRYYDSLEEIQSIRITGMDASSYARYVEAGEMNIAVLEKAMDEIVETDIRAGITPYIPEYIPMPTKLPDMYMRHDRWEDAMRVYDFCAKIPYLTSIDFEQLKAECEENRKCADEIEALISNGVVSQKAVKKALSARFGIRHINYCLGYLRRFNRVKSGSDYILSITSQKDRF